jgi:hypothetical protein
MPLTQLSVDDGPHNMDGYCFLLGTVLNKSRRS